MANRWFPLDSQLLQAADLRNSSSNLASAVRIFSGSGFGSMTPSRLGRRSFRPQMCKLVVAAHSGGASGTLAMKATWPLQSCRLCRASPTGQSPLLRRRATAQQSFVRLISDEHPNLLQRQLRLDLSRQAFVVAVDGLHEV